MRCEGSSLVTGWLPTARHRGIGAFGGLAFRIRVWRRGTSRLRKVCGFRVGHGVVGVVVGGSSCTYIVGKETAAPARTARIPVHYQEP